MLIQITNPYWRNKFLILRIQKESRKRKIDTRMQQLNIEMEHDLLTLNCKQIGIRKKIAMQIRERRMRMMF